MRITLLSAFLLASGITSAAAPIDGWYTSVFGGYTYLPGNVENYTYGYFLNNSSFNGGYNAGARVGFQSNPLRYEAEYTYLHADAKAYQYNNIQQEYVYGYASANMIMANVYYDTPEILPAIAPFLGAGIGYAYVEQRLNSAGPFGYTAFGMDNGSFAYQGTIGFTYNFSTNYSANLAYRYVATSSSDVFGNIFQAHIANAGVIYRFDGANYK